MRLPAYRPLALLDLSSCYGNILPIRLAIVRAPALIYMGPPRVLATVGDYIQLFPWTFPKDQ